MKIFVIFVILIASFSCSGNKEENNAEKNIFGDETLRKIYELQDKRDSKGLLVYLKDKNPLYRKYSALAFASVQDKDSVKEVTNLLSDEAGSVRRAAAYALGQTGSSEAESILLSAFKNEVSADTKMVILEAVGKCGNEKGLKFLSTLDINKKNNIVLKGQALGLYRFILKKKHLKEGIKNIFKILKQSNSGEVRFYAANCLSRIRDIDFSDNFEEIKKLFTQETEERVKMHLILAMGK